MTVCVCSVRLRLPENESLKGKRHVLKSIIERVKNRFNVSISEIDNNDAWQLATLGIAFVSNDRQHVDETLAKVVNFISDSRFEIEMIDYRTELLSIL